MTSIHPLAIEVGKRLRESMEAYEKEKRELQINVSKLVHESVAYNDLLDSQSGEEAWPDYLDLINHVKEFMKDTSAEVLENITINDTYGGSRFPIKERLGDISIISGCLTFTMYPTRDQRQYNLEDISDASEIILGQRISILKETNGREIRRFLKPRLSGAILRQYEI